MNLPDSGERATFTTGAMRDYQGGKGRFDLVPLDLVQWLVEDWHEYPYQAVWALARLYEAGAQKYAERNWEKGIPLIAYYNSSWRHIAKHHLAMGDEPHLTQWCWNLLCLYWTERKIKEGELPIELREKMSSILAPIDGVMLRLRPQYTGLNGEASAIKHGTLAQQDYFMTGSESRLCDAVQCSIMALELQQRRLHHGSV